MKQLTGRYRVFTRQTLLRRPERDDLIPGVDAGVRLTKSGFMTPPPLLSSAFRGVSKEDREVEDETGLSIICILAAWANSP